MMEESRKNIDDLFRDELGDYAETPPPAVWESLEGKLRRPGGLRPAYLRLGYFGLLLLVATLSVSIAKIIGGSSADKTIASSNATNESSTAAIAKATKPTADNHATATGPAPATTNGDVNTTNKTPNTTDNNETTTANKEQTVSKERSSNSKHRASGAKHYASRINHPAPLNNNLIQARSGPAQQAKPAYNAAIANTASKSGPAADESGNAQADDNKQNNLTSAGAEQGMKKGEQSKDEQKKQTSESEPAKEEQKNHKRPGFSRFEAGIKAGYERSFLDQGATKGVVSPYLQFNLSPKVALMTQPSVKYAHVNINKIGADQSYYKEHADSSTTYISSTPIYVVNPVAPAFYENDYSYHQTHDSIVKSYATGGTFTEFEFPILLKYAVTKGFSLYGGVNLSYSKLTAGIKESTYQSQNIAVSKDSFSYSNTLAQAVALPVKTVLTYSGTPYSSYNGPVYSSPTSGLFRYGYMLGFSYEFSNRWLFDGLIQQTPTKSDIQAGYNINTPLSSTYFRLTIGYKVIK